MLGMSLINNNEFELGIEELVHLVGVEPQFKKSLYLVIALAYKRIEQYDAAIEIVRQVLSSWIREFRSTQITTTVWFIGASYI